MKCLYNFNKYTNKYVAIKRFISTLNYRGLTFKVLDLKRKKWKIK